MPKKNLAICIPSGRFVDFGFFQSFANTIAETMFYCNTAVFTVASPMIFENRNELVRRVFSFEGKSGFAFDFMLWIDNDIVFNFGQVKKLLSHLEDGEDFVSGVYYNPKDGNVLPVAYFADGERYRWLEEKDVQNGGKDFGLLEVDAVGFGFCAMKMDLMREIFARHKPRPFNLRQLDDGSLVTEDQVFCERAKEAGAKIMLDSSIVVKHAKGYLPR
ncbi:Uncharacterised protein [uncultured archaeon]|nr:Uncharacterised protein [uncultured archaeon]